MIRLTLLAPFLLFACLELSAQDIGGVINRYASITTVDRCKNSVELFDLAGFAESDTVILIQMQGALCDSATGTIRSMASAGRFEKNVIDSIRGNVVTLRFTMIWEYNPSGAVQMVSMPRYQTARVVQPLTCLPWNGVIGGVLAFELTDSLFLNANIDVSGRGFRGSDTTSTGEGVAGISDAAGIPWGSGGGWKHELLSNSIGGGGGGHQGCGGIGRSACSLPRSILPGAAEIRYDAGVNWIFMGSGGGSGAEFTQQGTKASTIQGGNGGGLIIGNVPVVIGDGVSTVLANGQNGAPCSGGNAQMRCVGAGGGAGGAILLTASAIRNVPFLSVHGGNATGTSAPFDAGVGGGGGGGTIRLGTTSPLNLSLGYYDGGNSGSEICVEGKACSGRVYYNTGINVATQKYVRRYVLEKADTAMCINDSVVLWAETSGAVSWFEGQTLLCDSCDTLLVSPKQSTLYYFTTLYKDLCSDTGNVFVDVHDLPDPAITQPNPICIRDSALISAAAGMTKYEWSTGQTTQSIFARTAGWYGVRVTNANGCEQSDSVELGVLPKRVLVIDELGGQPELVMPSVFPFELSTLSFTIRNTFVVPAEIRGVTLAGNTAVSVALWQFPFTVMNGQSHRVTVTGMSAVPGEYRDTITIIEPCGETLLPVTFTVFETPWYSKCSVRVTSVGEMEEYLKDLANGKIEYVVINLLGSPCGAPYAAGTYIVRTASSAILFAL